MNEDTASAPRRTLPVAIGDNTYSITSDDQYLAYIAGGFEPDTVRLLTALAEPDHTVLDIGANIGCTALLFASMTRAVHAFEPSPSTFALLGINVAASGLDVQLHNFGLGDREFEGEITFSPNNRSGGFVSDRMQAGAGFVTERISVRSLDSFLRGRPDVRPDLVKIDVEGFELHVLRGAAETLGRLRPVVTLELNHWCLNAFQRTSIPDFFDALRARFPLLWAVDEKQNLRADLHDESTSYRVMYHHILHMRWTSIVAAFEPRQLDRFHAAYPAV